MERFKLNSPLPSKETKIYKKAMKCYDQKNYRNGIKYSKQILSNEKCSNHVDTLCLLSLMLHFTGKNEEAIKTVKLALSYNFKNSVSWHTYGTIHRNNHCYEESAKCFIQAIKFDQENTQLLLELGTIQIHQRDYQNAVVNREKLLKIKNGQRQLWLAYIVSLQLAKKPTTASAILKNFASSMMESNSKGDTNYRHQFSNIFLSQIKFYVDQSLYHKALEVIQEKSSSILDEMQLEEFKAKIYINTNNKLSAIQSCVKLLKLNPENKDYYFTLKSALDCTCSFAYQKIVAYLHKVFPTAIYPTIHLLELSQGEEFAKALKEYVNTAIDRRQPNLFNVLMPLYEDDHKVSVIEIFLLKLQEERSNDPNLVWVLYCLAQHFNYCHLFLKALHISELVITLAPDFIDGVIFKGIICKNLGRIADQIDSVARAHDLDTADRNVKISYCITLLKYNQMKQAEEIGSVYSIKTKPLWEYMREIQFLEMFQKISKMFFHKSDLNRSLNVCLVFENFFTTFMNSLMDFHMYSMRKAIIIPYLNLHENSIFLRQNNFFYKVARTAVKCCLSLIYIQLNDTSKHKSYDSFNSDSSDLFQSLCLDPHEHIQIFLTSLLNFDSNKKNYYLAFEYYYISGKILLMLKMLSKLIEIAPNSPKIAYYKIKFEHFYSSNKHNEFCSEIISLYPDLLKKCSHDITLCDFPTNDYLSCLYRYKIDLFLGHKQFDIDTYIEIFNNSIKKISQDWIKCYEVYKEFVFSKEALGIPKIREKLIDQLIELFPGCYLDKRIDDAI